MRERTLKARTDHFRKHAIDTIANRTSTPATGWWLSFVGKDDGFRGAVIVQAEDFTTALMECNLRGINPHGEVQGAKIPAEIAALIPDHWKNRILSREECAQFDAEMGAKHPQP